MAQTGRTTLKTYFNRGDRPTEDQFADLIDSFLNKADESDQILPAVSSGDAGKITRINTGESGWENYADILVGESGNTINYVGTNKIIWTHDPSDLDGDARTFNLNVHVNDGFPNQTRADTVWQIGYNLDGINGPLDNTDHAFGLQFESFYNANKSVAQWELFTISYDVNGDQFRPISCHGPVDATANDVNYNVSFTSEEVIFYQPDRVNVEIDQRILINFNDNYIYFYEDDAGDGLKLINRANNAQFIKQHDSGGNEIPLIFLANTDEIFIGQGGIPVKFNGGIKQATLFGTGTQIGNTSNPTNLIIRGRTSQVIQMYNENDGVSDFWYLNQFNTTFEIGYSAGNKVIKLSGSAPAASFELKSDGAPKFPNLPTSDPVEAGVLWNDAGTVKVSAG